MKRSSISAILLLAQIIFSFVLGVFGNKLSELIQVPSVFVLLGSGVIIVLSLFVGIWITTSEHSTGTIENSKALNDIHRSTFSELFHLAFNRIVTIFPIAIILGVIFTTLFIYLIPRSPRFGFAIFTEFSATRVGPWNYELVSFIVALVTTYIMSVRKKDTALVITYAVGLGMGISATELTLRPFENEPLLSYILWLSSLVLLALMFKLERIQKFIQFIFESLMKERQ